MLTRISGSIAGRIRSVRSHPLLNPAALRESVEERRGSRAVEAEHRPHLHEAIDWLVRSQDATPDDGFSRGYSLVWNPYFQARGWQPSYPETTGYIIPTLYLAARVLDRPDLAQRAERAARWELAVQLESGAVQGGVIGQPPSPAVFNTGQVLFGLLEAFQETGDGRFADGALRAGRYLVQCLDEDGLWRRGNSRFARGDATLYNARAAWGLAAAGVQLAEPTFVDASARALGAVARRQRPNGWFPDCCLHDPERPLLHTIAYTIRGLLEGGQVLQDASLIDAAARAAAPLADLVRTDGWLSGRFTADWHPAAQWSCLTGEAQMANIWMRLFEITEDPEWLRAVPATLRFLKSTQNRTTSDPGIRGGIKGSFPTDGRYGRYEVLNWATKFFADALMREGLLALPSARPASRSTLV